MSKKKKKQPKWRKQNGILVATILSVPLDQIALERQARRQQMKEAGALGTATGTGAHGGSKRDYRRRNRRDANDQTRNFDS